MLETGRLALGGDPATLWSDERIRDAYLGGAQTKALAMTVHIPADALTDFCAEIFERVGSRPEEARAVAASLVDANLTGHDSHGVMRVPRYVDWVRSGDTVPNQTIARLVDTPVIAVLDGRYGFGQIVAPRPSTSASRKRRRRGFPRSRCAIPAMSAGSANGRSARRRRA